MIEESDGAFYKRHNDKLHAKLRIAALEDELAKAKQYKCPIGMDDARQFCSVGHCAACASDLRAQLTLALSQRDRAVEECIEAVKNAPSLDENGYICEKSAAIKAIRARSVITEIKN